MQQKCGSVDMCSSGQKYRGAGGAQRFRCRCDDKNEMLMQNAEVMQVVRVVQSAEVQVGQVQRC